MVSNGIGSVIDYIVLINKSKPVHACLPNKLLRSKKS